ncbi:alkaline phosphatase [Gaertneriomyces semiglobifer]|nr:alkaline phosphatase [Gaertneriomyces semiglobifer]
MSASVVDFKHGVASGDPLADSVILWTKVTPTTPQPVSVNYQVSLTKDFAAIISQGTVLTSSEVDYTVKVDVSGLSPSTTYYYRFVVGDTTSPVGRTKTLPAENVDPENVKLAVVSCSNLPYGFFNAYGNIAKKDVDMVLHLGDYIYEYGNGEYGDGSKFNPPRIPQPNAEILSLSDYRQRHAQYKTDPDLQAAHQSHPFITIWDDHEFTDNATPDGAANHQANEGPWSVRRLNAIRAYFEYMPIRQAATDHFGKIYRSFKVGKMLDLIMLDTRMHGMDNGTSADPSKNLLGKTQESWLHSTLSASKSRGAYWRVLGNQVIMAPLTIVGVNPSALEGWDDFPDTRARLLSHLTSNSIKNNIVVTGDLHIAMAMNVPAVSPYNPFKYNWRTGEGSVLVEFVGTSVTSPGFNWALQSGLKLTQPHMWHVNGGKRGYMIVDLRREVAKSEYWIVDSVDSRNPSEKLDAVVQTLPGTGRISRVDTY